MSAVSMAPSNREVVSCLPLFHQPGNLSGEFFLKKDKIEPILREI